MRRRGPFLEGVPQHLQPARPELFGHHKQDDGDNDAAGLANYLRQRAALALTAAGGSGAAMASKIIKPSQCLQDIDDPLYCTSWFLRRWPQEPCSAGHGRELGYRSKSWLCERVSRRA